MATSPRSLLTRHPLHWVSFGLGSGLAPFAPGTWGTLPALLIYYLVSDWPLWWYLALIAVLTLIAIKACDFTSKALGEHDHSSIVIDEIVGMLIVLIPLLGSDWHWGWVALAFVLFRIFDILKPPPIAALDRNIRNGFGIVLDDVMAAIYALIALQSTIWIVNELSK